MGSNRYNKPEKVDYTPKGQKKEEEITLPIRTCLICNKVTLGYGSWNHGYTCSRKCEAIEEAKPRNFGEPNEKTSLSAFAGSVFSSC